MFLGSEHQLLWTTCKVVMSWLDMGMCDFGGNKKIILVKKCQKG